MDANGFNKIITDKLKTILSPLGFRKRHNNFTALCDDVILMIQVQRSNASTKDRLKMTVNLGVFSVYLAEKLGDIDRMPTIWDCHWRERIGFLLSKGDKWWVIENEAEAQQAGDELSDILTRNALPALEDVSSTAKLSAMWKKGQAPGLTEVQVLQYLSVLAQKD